MSDKDNQLENQQHTNAEADKWTQAAEVKPEAEPKTPSTASGEASGTPAWEREILSKVAFAAVSEQRRTRRWGIFFKLMTFAYLGLVLFLFLPGDETSLPSVGKKHTAIIEVNGVIASNAEASADAVISGLRAAFKDKSTAGVILRINSPGGSPVQAGYINDEIKRLKGLHPNIPVYAVVMVICASGGYYIAAAADQIYADKASLVGSIGVLMDGFGFVDTIEKLGMERRLLTAGESKGFLDPFSPIGVA